MLPSTNAVIDLNDATLC